MEVFIVWHTDNERTFIQGVYSSYERAEIELAKIEWYDDKNISTRKIDE